jgi:uncharacterized membrane protein
MKNKRKYEDSTATTAAEVAKKKLKKMSKKAAKPDSPAVADMKAKAAAFVQDQRKQANSLVDVMAFLGIFLCTYIIYTVVGSRNRIKLLAGIGAASNSFLECTEKRSELG